MSCDKWPEGVLVGRYFPTGEKSRSIQKSDNIDDSDCITQGKKNIFLERPMTSKTQTA